MNDKTEWRKKRHTVSVNLYQKFRCLHTCVERLLKKAQAIGVSSTNKRYIMHLPFFLCKIMVCGKDFCEREGWVGGINERYFPWISWLFADARQQQQGTFYTCTVLTDMFASYYNWLCTPARIGVDHTDRGGVCLGLGNSLLVKYCFVKFSLI